MITNLFEILGITLLLWLISRFIPGFVGVLYPDIISLKLILFLVLLPVGWFVTKSLSKGKHPKCIRINLYIFALLEMPGVLSVLAYILQNLSFSTGRYSTDFNGIPYSDYFSLFGIMILLEAVYIAMCLFLAKKTHNPEATHIIEQSCAVAEKNHDEKQRLRDEISKMKAALKEHDRTCEENKKILAEAFSDEELSNMVENGEFPANRVNEYIENRRSLELYMDFAPITRKNTVKIIGDLTKQLAELECEE